MTIEIVTQIIQLIVAPTVMVTACTLIQGGALGRYANISSRIRTLTRERAEALELSIYDKLSDDALEAVLDIVDTQLILLCRRHLLLRNAILIIYLAILSFLSSMMAIALTRVFSITAITVAVICLFLVGTMLLFLGVILLYLEIKNSDRAISFEVKQVMSLHSKSPQFYSRQ